MKKKTRIPLIILILFICATGELFENRRGEYFFRSFGRALDGNG